MDAPPLGITVQQSRTARLHSLVSAAPAIVRVVSGTKRVTCRDRRLEIGPGSYALLPEGLPLTIENVVPDRGPYLAMAIPIGRPVIERAYTRLAPETGATRGAAAPVAVGTPPEEIDTLYAGLCEARPGPALPPPILDLRLEELALRFALAGALFGHAVPPTLSDRVRGLINDAPADPWRAADAARRLGVSEPTLRRRLATEGNSFTDILRDVRMTRALGLLQSTRLTVLQVAAEVGYGSASQFAARFRERFGLAPHEIRSEAPQNDRIGT